MTYHLLTDRRTGAQYIYNPGQPDHGSSSEDGINWDRPIDDDHLAQRQIIMGEIMAQAERDWEVKAERQRERDRLAALHDEALANHIGNMETPEAIRERAKARIEALKAKVNKKTIGEHLMSVLGCAMFAVCLAASVALTIACVDIILKTVRAW
jgi:hypothetical protein